VTNVGQSEWHQFLTDMENELDAHEEAVRLGETGIVPAWQEPTDLGPLPLALHPRVTHLISRIGLLSTFVQYAMNAAENDLAHLERQSHRGTAAAVSLYLDSSV